jgi:signal peptidase II
MKYMNQPLFIAISIIDRITKYWAFSAQGPTVITSWLSFQTTLNHGLSWGLFPATSTLGNIALISVITATLSTVLSYTNHSKGLVSTIGRTAIFAGAVSNLYDRMLYGAVVDFIELSYKDFVWPNFNVADIAIVIGVICLLTQDVFSLPVLESEKTAKV